MPGSWCDSLCWAWARMAASQARESMAQVMWGLPGPPAAEPGTDRAPASPLDGWEAFPM